MLNEMFYGIFCTTVNQGQAAGGHWVWWGKMKVPSRELEVTTFLQSKVKFDY